jgi:hypothetical protein
VDEIGDGVGDTGDGDEEQDVKKYFPSDNFFPDEIPELFQDYDVDKENKKR